METPNKERWRFRVKRYRGPINIGSPVVCDLITSQNMGDSFYHIFTIYSNETWCKSSFGGFEVDLPGNRKIVREKKYRETPPPPQKKPPLWNQRTNFN
jgi:hypothetical protein